MGHDVGPLLAGMIFVAFTAHRRSFCIVV